MGAPRRNITVHGAVPYIWVLVADRALLSLLLKAPCNVSLATQRRNLGLAVSPLHKCEDPHASTAHGHERHNLTSERHSAHRERSAGSSDGWGVS